MGGGLLYVTYMCSVVFDAAQELHFLEIRTWDQACTGSLLSTWTQKRHANVQFFCTVVAQRPHSDFKCHAS
eukprot:5533273-Amphidinium_carterae.1